MRWGLIGMMVVTFCVRNLPWQLDDFDQAKQAYTSYEMVHEGHWWFQHTPQQKSATKPPFSGWLSAGFHAITGGWWDGAWRLPSLLSALVILGLLVRAGDRLLPGWGGLVASVAFGLNLMSARLATLVRTDMFIACTVFVIGFLVYEKLRTGAPWTRKERWVLFALIAASMLTKGPVACIFLLPGLAVMWWRSRREGKPSAAWFGWWPWLLALLLLFTWAVIGSLLDREFYEEVVLKEFAGRVTGEHRSQPVYYYLPHLLQKFMPWSLLLIALPCVREVRTAVAKDRSLLWLATWALGGLVVWSLIPSKRTDRIFPVLAPLCLLLPGLLRALPEGRLFRWPARKVVFASIIFAIVCSEGYAVYQIATGYAQHEDALIRFGRSAKEMANAGSLRLGVVTCLDEGLLLYTDEIRFLELSRAKAAWQRDLLDALVVGKDKFEELRAELGPHRVLLECEKTEATHGSYVFVTRDPRPLSP